jgi:hypothetical protein
LWLDFDQELNIKDVEDFLTFPTGIHMPSYDQWFMNALSKLTNAAGILSWIDLEGIDYFKYLTKIQNESCRSLKYEMRRHLPQISDEYLRALLR